MRTLIVAAIVALAALSSQSAVAQRADITGWAVLQWCLGGFPPKKNKQLVDTYYDIAVAPHIALQPDLTPEKAEAIAAGIREGLDLAANRQATKADVCPLVMERVAYALAQALDERAEKEASK